MHFLGALRSVAQYYHMSGYSFAYVVVVMDSVVVIYKNSRKPMWILKFNFRVVNFYYILYFSFSRINRVPFDLPEAESGGISIRISCWVWSLGFAFFLLKSIQIWY